MLYSVYSEIINISIEGLKLKRINKQYDQAFLFIKINLLNFRGKLLWLVELVQSKITKDKHKIIVNKAFKYIKLYNYTGYFA